MSVRTSTVGPLSVGVLANVFSDLVARLAQAVGEKRGGVLLLVRQLGMLVELLVSGYKLGQRDVHQ